MALPYQRVNVYIDGGNLYGSVRTLTNRTQIDLLAFARKLVGERHLQRIYYFIGEIDSQKDPERASGQQRFLEALRNVDYLELRLGRLAYRNWSPRPYEKGIDIKNRYRHDHSRSQEQLRRGYPSERGY